jgi:hypothetical protein
LIPELSKGLIVEWGECLPDCPQEEVTSVCIMEPDFPKFSDGTPGTANFTSNYRYGSGVATLDVRTYALPSYLNPYLHTDVGVNVIIPYN